MLSKKKNGYRILVPGVCLQLQSGGEARQGGYYIKSFASRRLRIENENEDVTLYTNFFQVAATFIPLKAPACGLQATNCCSRLDTEGD